MLGMKVRDLGVTIPCYGPEIKQWGLGSDCPQSSSQMRETGPSSPHLKMEMTVAPFHWVFVDRGALLCPANRSRSNSSFPSWAVQPLPPW